MLSLKHYITSRLSEDSHRSFAFNILNYNVFGIKDSDEPLSHRDCLISSKFVWIEQILESEGWSKLDDGNVWKIQIPKSNYVIVLMSDPDGIRYHKDTITNLIYIGDEDYVPTIIV